MPPPGLVRDESGNEELGPNGELLTMHVTSAQAEQYGLAVAREYEASSRRLSRARAIFNTVTIGTAASALGMAATEGATKAISALGLAGAGVAAIGPQWVVTSQQQIYTLGARRTLCAVKAAQNVVERPAAVSAIALLQAKLLSKLSELKKRLDQGREGRSESLAENARAVLDAGYATSERATMALNDADPLGGVLVTIIEEIRALVEIEISKSEPDLLAYDEALKNSLRTSSGVQVPGAAPETPPPPPGPDRFAADFTDPELTGAMNAAQDATAALNTALAQVQPGPPLPPGLFDSCIDPNFAAALATLTITPAELSLKPGKNYEIVATVSGGNPPYTFVFDAPKEVVLEKGADANHSPKSVSISVPEANAVDGNTLTLVAMDQRNLATRLVIAFKK